MSAHDGDTRLVAETNTKIVAMAEPDGPVPKLILRVVTIAPPEFHSEPIVDVHTGDQLSGLPTPLGKSNNDKEWVVVVSPPSVPLANPVGESPPPPSANNAETAAILTSSTQILPGVSTEVNSSSSNLVAPEWPPISDPVNTQAREDSAAEALLLLDHASDAMSGQQLPNSPTIHGETTVAPIQFTPEITTKVSSSSSPVVAPEEPNMPVPIGVESRETLIPLSHTSDDPSKQSLPISQTIHDETAAAVATILPPEGEFPVISIPEKEPDELKEVPILHDAWDHLKPFLKGLQKLEQQQPGLLEAIQRTMAYILPLALHEEYIIPPLPRGKGRGRSKPRHKRVISSSSESSPEPRRPVKSASPDHKPVVCETPAVKTAQKAPGDKGRKATVATKPTTRKPVKQTPAKGRKKTGSPKPVPTKVAQDSFEEALERSTLASGSKSKKTPKKVTKSRSPSGPSKAATLKPPKTTEKEIPSKRELKSRTSPRTSEKDITPVKPSAVSKPSEVKPRSPLEKLYSATFETTSEPQSGDGKRPSKSGEAPLVDASRVTQAPSPTPPLADSGPPALEKPKELRVSLTRLETWGSSGSVQVVESVDPSKATPFSDPECLDLDIAESDRTFLGKAVHLDTNYSSSEPDLPRVASIVVVPKTTRVETVTTSSAVVTTTTSFIGTQENSVSHCLTSTTTHPNGNSPPVLGGVASSNLPVKTGKVPFCKRCQIRGHKGQGCQRPILLCENCDRRGHLTSDCYRPKGDVKTSRRTAEEPAMPAQRIIRPAYDFPTYAEDPSTSQGRRSYPSSTQTSREYVEGPPRAWENSTEANTYPQYVPQHQGYEGRPQMHGRPMEDGHYPRVDVHDRLGTRATPDTADSRWREYQEYKRWEEKVYGTSQPR